MHPEEFVNHEAGLDGRGGSSYIDLVICRNRDDSSAFTSSSDGVLETRRYYCQNWRADVIAFVSSSGWLLEQDRYASYGTPFGLAGGDTNSDGDCDTADSTQIQTWINGSVYDIRGDIDLDGDVDATDKSRVDSAYLGTTLGWSVLGSFGNRKGFAGYDHDPSSSALMHVRFRAYESQFGRWNSRDPIGYDRSNSLYAYLGDSAVAFTDPLGLWQPPVPGHNPPPSVPGLNPEGKLCGYGPNGHVGPGCITPGPTGPKYGPGLGGPGTHDPLEPPRGGGGGGGAIPPWLYNLCCQLAKKDAEKDASGQISGAAVCCFGTAIACSYIDVSVSDPLKKFINEAVSSCVLAHESGHVKYSKAYPDCYAPCNPGTVTGLKSHAGPCHILSEYNALQAELGCLNHAKAQCANAPSSGTTNGPDTCNLIIDIYIHGAENELQKHKLFVF